MKRLSGAALTEQYPATTDAWAELLSEDEGEIALLRPLLAETSLEEKPLRLAYDADENGWSADAFHEAVNTFGAAIVVGETVGGAVIGGYNPRGWIGLGEDRDSMAAFLFTWRDGDMTQRATKLPKVYSKLGSYYAKTPDGSKTLFADGEAKRGKPTELRWLRAYVAAGDAEKWELDGIIWKSSQ